MDFCDGLDPKYILLHGLSGITPFAEMPGSGALVEARRDYLPAFVLKREPLADMRAAIADLMKRVPGRVPRP